MCQLACFLQSFEFPVTGHFNHCRDWWSVMTLKWYPLGGSPIFGRSMTYEFCHTVVLPAVSSDWSSYEITRFVPSILCVSTSLISVVLASDYMVNGLWKSGQARIGVELNSSFIFLNVSAWALSHFHKWVFLSNSSRGVVIEAAFGMKQRYHDTRLRNLWRVFRLCNAAISLITLILYGSMRIPCLCITWPRYNNSSTQNLHFSRFIRRQRFLYL